MKIQVFDTCSKGRDMDLGNSEKWLANKILKQKCEKCLKNKKSLKCELNLNGSDL